MRFILLACFALWTVDALAAAPSVHRDLPYTVPRHDRQMLDLYAPAEGKDHPVLIWIHGGGWRQGDKAAVQQKPQAFVDRGFVFVSVNYRLAPEVDVKQMTGDIAKAIRWVREHAQEYGGSREMIFVAGHSAGAHLAALVCTDDRYLASEGVPLANIKGCIPVDTAAYDVVERAKSFSAPRVQGAANVFGSDASVQKDLSPIVHVAKDNNIPPFLILHVADRADSRAQSQAFAKALQAAGAEAEVVAGRDKTHAAINRDLGLADDEPTKAGFQFLDRFSRTAPGNDGQ
jgi:acetyl esterase/lipase